MFIYILNGYPQVEDVVVKFGELDKLQARNWVIDKPKKVPLAKVRISFLPNTGNTCVMLAVLDSSIMHRETKKELKLSCLSCLRHFG